VITSPFTFIGTVEPFFHIGARPVFADIDPCSFNLDPKEVEKKITLRTRAIVPVHMYGQPTDMDPILEIARRRNLLVIEDAAQAHGAHYRGHHAGSLGDAGCFSFYPGKNLGAYGDAGMVVTNDSRIADQIRLLRNHGRYTKYEHSVVGYGERIDALQSAILDVKLRYLERWVEERRQVAARYRQLLKGAPVIMPEEMAEVRHAYHLFVLMVQRRDEVLEKLKSKGIAAGVHYPVPLHLQPALAGLGYRKGDFPHAERAAAEALSLPTYPEITEKQQQQVVAALLDCLRP
jgi:dTDP-4-amino-4,6-dideoxygalactose transaminase